YLEDGTYIPNVPRDKLCPTLANPKNVLWVDLEDPTEDEIAILRNDFGFHPLLIDDCIASHSQPKIDEFNDYFFLVLHSCYFYTEKETADALDIREIDIFVGKNFVITYHKGHIRSISTNRKRCEHGPQIMSKGADFLLYSLLDALVDNYFPIMDTLSERLAEIEEEILTDPHPLLQAKIFAQRRNMVSLRKIVGPQREIIARFMRPGFPFISEEARPYFKDIYDHLFRIYDITEMSRELIAQDMESYISSINWRLNETMKTLTIIATFLLPIGTIASFYGMNVELPEFKWGIWGYLAVWFWMIVASLLTLVYFKKRRMI
ncbi:MAG: magnesium/cobalt transporter CorA, partial [Candidatus Aureabacteria bacterium]|nr:magnesium/cobalt transporter CorA [Candidatus Auribacterota bacterium]